MKLVIPGEPCAKQRPRLGKRHTYTPDKTVNYETLVKQLYITQGHERLEGALKMTVNAFFSIPKSASKKNREKMLRGEIRPTKRPDWDNVGKIISDALNEMAYKDDCQIVDATVRKWYSDNPRVEVEITELTPEVFAEWD
ncbi:MAG: RusA family crossover junction endodeoxyribonuclease [Clostridiaceae bacterium]|nr:RusA family crossover junction endodeoxyribonuclease [Clostridiaceae bacterium]